MLLARRTTWFALSLSLSLSLLTALVVLWAPPAQAQSCGEHDFDFHVNAHATVGSAKLTYDWDALPYCEDFVFHHYLVCRLPGTTIGEAPDEPTDAGAVCEASVSNPAFEAADDLVHRSAKSYAARIFACDDTDCTDWYGSGTTGYGSVTDEANFGATETEEWDLVGITTKTDVDRVIDHTTDEPVSTTMLFYPEGHSLEHQAGFWWSDNNGYTYYLLADEEDPGNQDWNTYSDWTASKELVAQEATVGEFAYGNHPWAVMANVDDNDVIRMYFQTNDSAAEQQIFSVDSTDDDGTDFGIACDDGGGDCDDNGCSYEALCDYTNESDDGDKKAVIEIAAENAPLTDLRAARHGKLLWDYLETPVLDFDEAVTPGMVFTGKTTYVTTEDCYNDHGEDDILQADWSGSWVLQRDGEGCVESKWDQYHDPGVIPLPDGAFKMYAKLLSGDISVIYWDPVAKVWEDEQTIEINLGGTSTDMNNSCFQNPDTAVYVEGSTINEIMFVRTIDDGGVICFGDYGIAYAKHVN